MVEWKELGQLGRFENIGTDKKTNEGEKLVTLLNYVDVYHHKYIDSSIPQMQVSASDRKIIDCTVEQGDIFVTPSSETVDDIGHSSIITETISNAVYSYHIMRFRLFEKNMLLSYYINYAFDSDIVKKQILKKAQGLTRFGLSIGKFSSIQIPVPSISEQTRIVEIFDKFTTSIENLKQQIAERRKQFEYYRDQLLDLKGKEGVEMNTLGDVCIIKNGYTPSTKNPVFWDGGTLPWFTLEDIRKNGRILNDAIKHITPLGVKRGGLFQKESIIISTTATIGEYALINTDFLCNQQITCLSIKETRKQKLLAKFLYYLSYGIGKWCKKNVNGGGSLQIVSTSKLNNLMVPISSIEEQNHIVTILDTFEASIANLEAQLELREKQYEYYRNKLLTFE